MQQLDIFWVSLLIGLAFVAFVFAFVTLLVLLVKYMLWLEKKFWR